MTLSPLNEPLALPCGVVVKNRFMKSAMSEALASRNHAPTPKLECLYSRWARGGAGILVTGNVMVDGRHIGEPGNVVAEDETHLEKFSAWAASGTGNGTELWMQLNHPGKQAPGLCDPSPVAPSAIPLKLTTFKLPRALTLFEIYDIIDRFGRSAALAKKAGFTGVQIHGAHGYLVSQFLSARHNIRTDAFGGCLENRFRFLALVYEAIRGNVGNGFPVSVKINSADFQKGGFSEEESLTVMGWLSAMGIDLIEISGGNYEAPAMMSMKNASDSTRKREAYFLKFAETARKEIRVPLAVTGGFRTGKAMAEALNSGALDIVGVARPMVLDPDFPCRVSCDKEYASTVEPVISTGIKAVDRALMIPLTWYTCQIHRLGAGRPPRPNLHPWQAALELFLEAGWQNFSRKRA